MVVLKSLALYSELGVISQIIVLMESHTSRSKSTSRLPTLGRTTQSSMLSLQAMVDRYISMYEYEKTTSIVLDEEIGELNSRLLESNVDMSSKVAQLNAEAASLKLQKRAAYLQHQLEIVIAKVSSTSTVNRRLREEIDTMRSSAIKEEDKIAKLEEQHRALMERTNKEASFVSQEQADVQRLTLATDSLRSKSTNQLLRFNESMRSLSVRSS